MRSIIRYLTIAVALYLSAMGVNAQTPGQTLAIQAKRNADATRDRDYETAVRFMYPPIV